MIRDVKEIYMLMLSTRYGAEMLDIYGETVDACLPMSKFLIERLKDEMEKAQIRR
jgi:hypothetical protein